MNLEHLHPFIVHFSIAWYLAAVMLDVWGSWSHRQKYHQAAWINLIIASVAVLASIASGLLAESRVWIPQSAGKDFEVHETLAFLLAAGILAQLFWRAGKLGNFPRRFRTGYWLLTAVTAVLLITGAYYGGRLVYLHGVGIKNNPLQKPVEGISPKPPLFNPDSEMEPE
ncbi:MAG: DUF2231 domain-containing protein [Calditrichia bacterium]